MSAAIYELRRQTATLIFDLEDRFARSRGTRGFHPRPLEPVRLFVVARIVLGLRQDFARPLELIVQRNGSGYHIFFNAIRQPDGSVRQAALDAGSYVVRVESRYYQTQEQTVALPTPERATFFDLQPGFNYPFPNGGTLSGGRGLTLLRGGLHATGGRGLAGARVEAAGVTDSYLTDETGQWALVFPDTQPSASLSVRVTFPDGSVENIANVHVVQGSESGLAQASLRGFVLTDAGGVIPGATVEVQGMTGATKTESDGSWFYYFDVNQAAFAADVTARLPDGRTRTQVNQLVQPRATVFVPTFRFP